MNCYLDNTELYLFNSGKNCYSYLALGCHKVHMPDGYDAYRFAVWAPNAESVSVVGSFNDWNDAADPMSRCSETGVWQAHIGIAHMGDTYKYAIRTRSGELIYKADPFAFFAQKRPGTASVIWEIGRYDWLDSIHMQERKRYDAHESPMSIYEVHLGSWKKGLNLDDMSDQLVRYVSEMGYTHIELMPVSEYPLDDSWGYQVTGYYAITSRYGTPQQFKHFVDKCHRAGLSVIVDWVSAHFPRDAHGLMRFDGTPAFESADSRRAMQPQWGTLMFDYGKAEVRSFLISNAVFLLKEYHIDALRVDAVSCMLYHDYGREDYEWLPNIYGGRENLEAIDFLSELSEVVKRECPGTLLIAEESTAFPYVTKPASEGGLGFDFKWNMGFMNDTLDYMSLDSGYRRYNHEKLTFSMCYAFSEHHVLPFSHDEVVHGKHSLLGRMNGDYDELFKQLRLLFMYQYAHPGKKLMFMGSEFGQFIEWDFYNSLDWFLLDYKNHAAMQEFVRELNLFYRDTPPMYELDDSWDGFEWISVDDDVHSVLAFARVDSCKNRIVCVYNFTPVTHENYRLRLSESCILKSVISSADYRSISYETKTDEAGAYADIRLWPYEAVYFAAESLTDKNED